MLCAQHASCTDDRLHLTILMLMLCYLLTNEVLFQAWHHDVGGEDDEEEADMDYSRHEKQSQRTSQGPIIHAMGLPDVTGPINPKMMWAEEEPDEA